MLRIVHALTLLFILTFIAVPLAAQPTAADPIDSAIKQAADAIHDEKPATGDIPSGAATAPSVQIDSPQATMFSFLGAINRANDGYEQAWDDVLRCFEQPSPYTAADIKALAQQLKDVIDKLGEVQESHLPDADALQRAAERGQATRRVKFFPRTAHQWVWTELQKATSGQIVAPAGEITLSRSDDGKWRFDAQTLADIPALYESMRALPPRYNPPQGDDGLGTDTLLDTLGPTFQRTSLTNWGILLLAIFLGVLTGKIVQTALNRTAQSLEHRNWKARGMAFRNAASPASLALLTAGLMIGMQFLYTDKAVSTFVWKIISFLYILSLGWLLYNLVDVVDIALRSVTEKTDTKLDDMIVPLIRKTLRIFLVIVFALVVAQNIFEFDVTGFLAGLGIAGLAVSLAAQDSVKNLFGSLTVFFDKPFLIGDFIVFNGITGTVEEIGFRSTRIRLLSGHLVTIPNMKFIDGDVENISARPYIRREMNVTITYDTPRDKIDEAVAILKDILCNDEQVIEEGRFDMQDFPPRVAFNELNADSLNIRAYYWYQLKGDPDRGFFTYMDHCQLVNNKLFERYGEAGIDFAFPTQTLYLAGDPARELAVTVNQGGQTQSAGT